ncbi:MAG: hypothetical protein AAFP02_09010 [Bacteroidota bacterium]
MKLLKNLLLLGSLLLAVACEKEALQKDDAVITAVDARKCALPFCGGYWIEIGEATYRFLELPEGVDFGTLDHNSDFPIAVKVKWSRPDDEDLKKAEDLIVLKTISRK